MNNVGAVFLRVLLIVVGAYVLIRLGRTAINKFVVRIEGRNSLSSERLKKTKTLGRIISNTIAITVGVIAAIMILGELGVDIGPVLAGAGVVGVAVGFGAQSLVKDLISGMFILLENHFNVGDVIKVGGIGGLVESMSLRVVTLRDLSGNVHIIPNGSIDIVTNMTKEWSRCVLDIGVAYKESVDHVMQVLKEIADELCKDKNFKDMILEPLQILGVDDFADSQVTIRVMFKTKTLQQWAVAREFRRRIKNTFDEKGIEIPFPHRTIYMGEGENTGKLVVEQKAT